MLRILIADDHPIIRKGIRYLLIEAGGFGEVYEAATRAETLHMVQAHSLDVVVMNTTLIDANSIDMLVEIKALQPDLPVVLLHPAPDATFAREALANGANGIVTKVAAEDELIKAIRHVVGAGVYVCSQIAALMNDVNGSMSV